MSNISLKDLIVAVKEKNLSKDELEAYRDQMSHLFAEIMLETADKEKEEAIFMGDKKAEDSVAGRKIEWKATQSGQRLIVLKRYALALKELLSSLKSRLYSIY